MTLVVNPRTRSDAAAAMPSSSRMPAFGVALFDNTKLATSGWACICGGEPTRFSMPAELSNSAIWVCNLEFDAYKAVRVQSKLRGPDYIKGGALRKICSDLGLSMAGQDAPQTAAELAKVIDRALRVAIRAYGWSDPLKALTSESLHLDIRSAISFAPRVDEALMSAMISAHQTSSAPGMQQPFQEDVVVLSLRANRLHHARQVMSQPVPTGAWRFARASEIDPQRWLDPKAPSLVEATIELSSVQPELATLIAFGASASGSSAKPMLRKWMCQVELAWISQYARVHVNSGYISDGGHAPLPRESALPEMLFSNPLSAQSYSVGLVAECHLTALVEPVRRPQRKEVSAWSVWLAARDREICYGLALAAYQAGFNVMHYGGGAVVIRTVRNQIPRVLDYCNEMGLTYPSFESIAMQHDIRELKNQLQQGRGEDI